MERQAKRACSIEQVGKQRTGQPRYWCSVHQAPATGRYGVRLTECESAYREIDGQNILELTVEDYPGGVALWGAVRPVLDTSDKPPEAGIHVHARKVVGGKKEIDATVDAVRLRYRRDLLDHGETIITRDTAINYYVSRYLNRNIIPLFCIHCGELHLDADYFAVKPHRKHLCHGCGRFFRDDKRAVSNPIALLRIKRNLPIAEPVRPNRVLNISLRDRLGGIQIWASNPALIWTAERPEEEGLHVHSYDADGSPVENDTYAAVTLDGVLLDEAQVKHYMAQSALAYLRNKIVSLACPSCGTSLFDRGELGFLPHSTHYCENCGEKFQAPGRRRLVVSNPFVETRQELLGLAGKNLGGHQ